jgi:hypothetical protein
MKGSKTSWTEDLDKELKTEANENCRCDYYQKKQQRDEERIMFLYR